MAFLNQKQDVFDIKLTSHGRKLFSQGKLKPAYYAFFDEDIIYDAQATKTGDTSEPQNNIEKRIKEETPRMEALYNWTRLEVANRTESILYFTGDMTMFQITAAPFDSATDADIEITPPPGGMFQYAGGLLGDDMIPDEGPNLFSWLQHQDQKVINTYNHDLEVGILQNYIWQEPLGTAKMGTQLAPSWDLQALKGTIASTQAQLQNDRFPTLDIPQIDIETKMITVVQEKMEWKNDISAAIAAATAAGHAGEDPIVGPFPDGTYIEIKKGEILISLAEENSLYQKENFDVEVFLVENPNEAKEEWIRLYFNPETGKQELQNLPLEAHTEPPKKYIAPPNYMILDNFLEIEFDNKISKEVLCATRAELKTKNLFSDLRINCGDIESFSSKNQVQGLYDVDTDDSEKIC